MEGQSDPAIRIVLTNCTDASREAEFNHWYDHIHFPDLLSAGVTRTASRYENADPDDPGARYLALYGLPHADLDAVQRDFTRAVEQLHRRGRMHPALHRVRRTMWRRIGPKVLTSRIGAGGLFIVESNCTDPHREEEFNQWYETMHIPDLLHTELFHTASRFEAHTGQDGGKYLAIYETDGDPLAAVTEFSKRHRPKLKESGRLSEIIEVTWRGIYRARQPGSRS